METLNRFRETFRSQKPVHVQELINECDGVSEDDDYLKSISSNRSYTDVHFLVLHGVVLFVLAIFLGYCLINGDIDRLTKGYDDCGNVCGKNNSFVVKYQAVCRSQDMTDKPFLLIGHNHRKCVQSCDGGTSLNGYQCVSKKNQSESNNGHKQGFVNVFIETLHTCRNEIAGLSAIALGLSFLVLLLLRYATMAFVWFSMIGGLLFYAVATAIYANVAATAESNGQLRTTAIFGAIMFALSTFCMILIMLVMRKRIELIIQLFKQAGKSIMTMPLLLFQPLLTFICLLIIWSAWFYFTLWAQTAGDPEELLEKVTFQPNTLTCTIILYNLFVMLWMVQFVCGCQNMIIAGAVSTWYFTKDTCKLSRPICSSAYNTIKYHLGTISVTSLIIALIQFTKFIIQLLRQFLRAFPCIIYCLNYVEQWMKYFTKNSLIVTAIRGHAFREAGSRAFKLIVENALQLVAVTCIGDFVIILAKILVTACVLGLGHFMIQHKNIVTEWPVLIVIGIMAYIIAHCFLSVYELAIDTLFICFCEDYDDNKGVVSPNLISRELLEFVEKCKMVVIVKVDKSRKVKSEPTVSV